MKALSVLAAAVALVLAPAAAAKFEMSLVVSDATPRIGQHVTVVVRSEVDLDYDLKVIAVAPGKGWFDVVGRVTGDSRSARASIPRDGFEVMLRRVSPNRWRGYVSFRSPGRWRLLIPNGAPVGLMIPPPVVRTVYVR